MSKEFSVILITCLFGILGITLTIFSDLYVYGELSNTNFVIGGVFGVCIGLVISAGAVSK